MTRNLFCLPLLFVCLTLSAETWRVTSLEWPPYSGADLPGQGIAIKALREVLALEGIELEVDFYPWKRAQQYALSPDYVGYFPAWPAEVKEGFIGSQPVFSSTVGVLRRADKAIRWTDAMELFERYRVGLVQTYIYPEIVDQAARAFPLNVDLAPNDRSLARKLSYGRTDVAITDPKVMLYYAKRDGLDNIRLEPNSLADVPLVLAFKNQEVNHQRLQRLNVLLEESD